MKPWFWLITRIGRGALAFALGGTLIFAVAGLVEGCLLGLIISFLLMPLDDKMAPVMAVNIVVIGTFAGFLSGWLGFMLAGLNHSMRTELRPFQFRYQPRDAPFWNCVRSALWASAMLASGGALTGAVCGVLWALLTHPDAVASRLPYEMMCLAIGSEAGAVIGFFAGVLTGALAPHSVQMARQRVKAGRQAIVDSWQAAQAEHLR
jgi:gas vesicle protein